MSDLPTGTVTFLFTDIEGSTMRWEQYPEAMRTALAHHDTLLRSVMTSHGGYVFKLVGDAVYAAFAVAADGVAAAVAAQRAVAAEQWGEVAPLRVRMALHTGAAQSRDDDYFGPTLNRVARVLSTGYGGQVLLSAATLELTRDSLPIGTSVQDLGEHALKDLLRPEHIFQLSIPDLPSDFPALKSLSRHPHNLPVQPTPFLGRQQEVATVCELLSRPEVRLLTLTGPGGIGKTRLGLQVAAELSDQFADGVFFVPLAPVSDAEQVVTTMIQTLGISEAGNQPLLVLLKSALKDKQRLLLLDNFEQVVQASVVVAELLAACPTLKVLVTSRVVLHVRAEREYTVPPLSLPNLKRLPHLVTLSQYEAVALFIERAQAVKSDFQVSNASAPAVAAICVHLDGLPLAIELAAARIKLLPPQALLARLSQRLSVLTGGSRDVPVRQQTLRNTIAWSYDLLDAAEQQLFRRLATFVGGCTLEAVEAVCAAFEGADGVGSVLDDVGSLIDKSLVQQTEQEGEEPRLVMLETIREYGQECLRESREEEASHRAHAEYYLSLAEEAEPHLHEAQQFVWLKRLNREQENFRAALRWLIEHKETEHALRLSGALHWYWYMRGYLGESLSWLQAALQLSNTGDRTVARAKVLGSAGMLTLYKGNSAEARALLEESIALHKALGDTRGLAFAFIWLGEVYEVQEDYLTARSLMEESVALCRQVGDKWMLAVALHDLAEVVWAQGNALPARALLEESWVLVQELGGKWGETRIFYQLADWARAQGDYIEAAAHYQEALSVAQQTGDMWIIAQSLAGLGDMARCQGDNAKALELYNQGLTIAREFGDQFSTRWLLCGLGDIARDEGNDTQAAALYREGLSLAMKDDYNKWGVGRCLLGLARIARSSRQFWRAAQLLGATEAQLNIERDLDPLDRAEYERDVADMRAHLGEEAFTTALAEGRTTPVEQVISNALKMGDEADKH